MQVNEEIDALETLGISPMEFLVLPRMLALVLMMPLLVLYADFGGILGGLLIAARSWNWWWEHFIRGAPVVWLPRSLGYGGAVTLTLAGLGAAYLLVLWIESRGGGGLQEGGSPEPGVRGLGRAVFRQGWQAAGGTAAGLWT